MRNATSLLLIVFLVSLSLDSHGLTQVGSVEGVLDVSSDGAAKYRIPIAVAPGIRAIQPNLAIEFNSSGGVGYMGPRFGITGLSQVSRCTATISRDGFHDPVDFDAADRFCLDGNLLVSDSYGGVSAEYRTELESFNKVTSSGGTANAPASFIVRTKEGLLLTYGGTDDSRVDHYSLANPYPGRRTFTWLLSRAEDPSGNAMDFRYTKDLLTNEVVPHEILYAANAAAGIPHYAKVSFEYLPWSAVPPVGWFLGMEQKRTRKLHRIKSLADIQSVPRLVREYRFGYTVVGVAQRPHLQTIEECGSDGTCLPATVFTWAPAVDALLGVNEESIQDLGGGWSTFAGDWDGDGKQDVLKLLHSTVTRARVHKSGGTSFSDEFVFDLGAAQQTPSEWTKLSGDFNGDGRTDLALVRNFIPVNNGNPYLLLLPYYSTGYGFTQGAAQTLTSTVPDRCACDPGDGPPVKASSSPMIGLPTERLVADFDADGIQDVLFVHHGTSTGVEVQVAVGQSNGLFKALRKQKLTESLPVDVGVRIGDLNRDGLPDIMTFRIVGSWVHTTIYANSGYGVFSPGFEDLAAWTGRENTSFHLFDANGDGNDDLVVASRRPTSSTNDEATLDVYVSAGDGRFVDAVSTTFNLTYRSLRAIPGDFNGDGIGDIAWAQFLVTNGVRVLGMSFYPIFGTAEGRFVPGVATPYANTWVTTTEYDMFVGAADLNGDGKDDIVKTNRELIAQHQAALGQAGRLAGIDDGLKHASLEYSTLHHGQTTYIAEKGTYCGGYPVRLFCGSMHVVSKVRLDNGSHPDRETTYSYSSLRFDLLGRGSLGFAQRTITDVTIGTTVTSTYLQDFPFTGRVSHQESTLPSGGLVSRSEFEYIAEPLISGSRKSQFVYLKRSTVEDYEVPPFAGLARSTRTTSVFADVPQYGNQTQLLVESFAGALDSGTPHISNTEWTYEPANVLQWRISMPRSMTESRTTPDLSSTVRLTEYENDLIAGYRTAEIVEPTRPELKRRTESVSRDAVGNVTQVTVSGANFQARTTNFAYDPLAPNFGRFQTLVTNPLSQSEYRTFDGLSGKVAAHTDLNGLVTNFTYDGFGRIREMFVDSTDYQSRVETSRVWCMAESATCAIGSGLHFIRQKWATGMERVTIVDQLNREVRSLSTNPDGTKPVVLTEYNMQGHVSRKSSPFFEGASQSFWTSFTYDVLGRIAQKVAPVDVNRPYSDSVKYEYLGLTTKELTNGSGRVRTIERDAIGQIKRVEFVAWGNPLERQDYEYDPFGNLSATVDFYGNRTSAEFDVRGNKRSSSDSTRGSWTFVPNALGMLRTQTDAKQQTTEFTYDRLNRIRTRTEPEGVTTWIYDQTYKGALDNVFYTATGISTPVHKRTLRYTPYGAMKTETVRVRGVAYVTGRTYDTSGRMETVTSPSGVKVQYAYGNGAEPTKAFDPALGPSTGLFWQSDSWDEWGRVRDLRYGSGVVIDTERDPAVGRVSAVLTAPDAGIQSLHYSWDASGNSYTRTDENQGGLTETFFHDGLDRLVRTSLNAGSTFNMTIGNTPTGNLSVKTREGVWLGNYTYDPARPMTLVGLGARTYSYDLNGNAESSAGRTIGWTSYNVPKQISQTGVTLDLTYGVERQLLQKTVNRIGEQATTRTYVTSLYEEDSNSGEVGKRTYVTGPQGVVAAVTLNGTMRTVTYLHKDRLGSIDAITSSGGTVLQRMAFDPHGKRRDVDWVGAPPAQTFLSAKGFTGHEHLDEVGLVHMGGRVYDPDIGRFLSPDPICADLYSPQAHNPYSYVRNRPMDLIDPSGFMDESPVYGPDFGPGFEVVYGTVSALPFDPSSLRLSGLLGPVNNVASSFSGSSQSGGLVAADSAAGQLGTVASDERAGTPGSILGGPIQWADDTFQYYANYDYSFKNLSRVFWRMLQSLPAEGMIVGTAGGVRVVATRMGLGSRKVVVLGHYPSYVQTAENIGARYLKVPPKYWDRLTPAEQWAANERFLERIIARGDEILLSTPAAQARPGSWYARELEYLTSHGYTLSEDGMRLFQRGPW